MPHAFQKEPVYQAAVEYAARREASGTEAPQNVLEIFSPEPCGSRPGANIRDAGQQNNRESTCNRGSRLGSFHMA